MFDLLFDTLAYRQLCAISDSERKGYKGSKIKMILKKFLNKRKDLKKHTKLKSNILMKEKKS